LFCSRAACAAIARAFWRAFPAYLATIAVDLWPVTAWIRSSPQPRAASSAVVA